jgi:hypothetical protein
VIIDHQCRSAVVTHHSQSNCSMWNRCKPWKLTLKYIQICSGNPNFFRSSTWNPVYRFSVSWHYPFNQKLRRVLLPKPF